MEDGTLRVTPPRDSDMKQSYVKPGDIIGFSGRSLRSDGINLVTGGIPRWGISHVGIVGNHNDSRYVFESTEDNQECSVLSESFQGVQAHFLSDILAGYDGRVWHYSLYRRLYQHEERRLSVFLHGQLGVPYDKAGAIQSGGLLWGLANSLLRGESLGEMFCSEVCAAAESRIGIFATTNASRWNPNKLIRTMRRAGLLHKRVRLK